MGQLECRNCAATIEQNEGYTPWCPSCDWNIDPEASPLATNAVEKQYMALGRKRGLKLFEALAMTTVENLRPRWSWTKIVAMVLAMAIHLSSLAIVAIGIWLMWVDWPNILLLIIGGLFLGFGWLLKPSMGRVPRAPLKRDDFPALYGLVDRVSDALGGERVRHIVIDGEFNAFYGQFGWSRTRVMGLGVPLWLAMTPQERLAVISHELAHGVNGDPNRSMFIGSAIDALHEWMSFLRPDYPGQADVDIGFAEVLTHYLLWTLSWPIAALAWLLVHLTWQESQEAEYLADYLAATASGTHALVSCLQKFDTADYLRPVFLRHAVSPDQSGAAIMEVFRKRVRDMPATEWERMRRKSLMETARLDSTHPPTLFRIKFLEHNLVEVPGIQLTQEDCDAIDLELEPLIEPIANRMINDFLEH